MELTGPAVEIASAWLLGLMIYFINPLNSATDPAGKMNYYHSENIKMRETVRKSYGGEIHLEWQELAPYIHSGFAGLFGWILMRLTAYFVGG